MRLPSEETCFKPGPVRHRNLLATYRSESTPTRAWLGPGMMSCLIKKRSQALRVAKSSRSGAHGLPGWALVLASCAEVRFPPVGAFARGVAVSQLRTPAWRHVGSGGRRY